MMSAPAVNSLQKPEGFEAYVRKFRVICVMHGVQIGSRTDLPGFMQKLLENRHLAMDFWGLVGKLSNREGGELSDDQILAVVVEGVTSSEISLEDSELKRPIDDLRAMLAGVDIHSPEQSQVEPAPFARGEADSRQGDEQRGDEEWRTRPVDPSQRTSGARAAFTSAFSEAVEQSAASPATLPPQLDEALLRLELTNLELKQHLDNIDKKIRRLEPQLDESNSTGLVSREMNQGLVEEPVLGVRAEPVGKPVSKTRLVLKPAEDSFAWRRDDPSIHIPLESYSQRGGYGRAVLFMLLVLVMAGAGFAGYRYRVPLQDEFAVLVHKIQSMRTATSANQSAPPETNSEDAPAKQVEQSQPSAEQPPTQGASPPQSPNAEASNSPNQVASNGFQAAKGRPDSNDGRKTIADRAAVPVERAFADGIPSAELAGAVRVDPAAMESRLTMSRVPAYPETAKVSRIQGQVVMQAIVSKDGTVKHLHVIQGDSRLRSAAMEAVSKWRYRPYRLNGQPVDVATTITVDFDLD
jgi:TonB family protein